MNLSEQSKIYYNEKGKNCAEAILLAASDKYSLGLGDADAKLIMGFGGGMGCGSVCGSLAGGIAVLSKLYGERVDIRDICGGFVKAFNERLGCNSIDCSVLAAKYKTAERRCEEAVLITAELLEQYIASIK